MNNEDKILELLQQMQKDISSMKEDIEDLKEGQEIIRENVNALVEWTEGAGYIIKYPFAQ